MLYPNIPLRHEDYFEQKANKIQQTKENFIYLLTA